MYCLCILIKLLQGGAISLLAGIQRPSYFAGVVLIGPLVIPDRKTATPFKVHLWHFDHVHIF